MQAAPIQVAYLPAADATVRTGLILPRSSGNDPLLEIRSSIREGTSEAYVRFDLSEAVSLLDNARLRVYARVAEPGNTRLMVRSAVYTDWREDTLAWTNKPDQGVTLGSVEIVGISPAWYELDLAEHVRAELAAGRKQITLALIMGGALENRVLVSSREAPDHQPELTGTRPAFSAKVSFLPATSTPPDGYLPDNGTLFGPRSRGLRYGWDFDNTEMMRDRARPKDKNSRVLKGPDRRHEVLAYLEHTKRTKSAKWEIAVPNGTYRVHLMAGDPQSYDSVYVIDAEGTTVVDGIPDKNKKWIEGTKDVKVRDGRLTLSSNPAGSKNKINFVEITELQP